MAVIFLSKGTCVVLPMSKSTSWSSTVMCEAGSDARVTMLQWERSPRTRPKRESKEQMDLVSSRLVFSASTWPETVTGGSTREW